MGQKWEKLIKFDKASLNSDPNGAEIGDGELQTALDVIFDNGVMEKAPGRTIVGAAHSSGLMVDGIFRSINDAGYKVLLRCVNGDLERWNGATWVQIQGYMSSTHPWDFINVGTKTCIVNGYDEAVEFDPLDNTIKKLGLEPPRFYKKVAYFETDETALWSLGSGHAFNSVFYQITERTGTTTRSLYITAGAAATVTSTMTYASAQDFSQYANAKLISNDDFFCISILHRERDYVDAIYVDFITTTGNYYRLTIDGTELDPITARDNVWTHIAAKKSRFVAVGSPNWASITKFAVSMVGQTGTAEAYVDNCYWKNPKIEVTKYKKVIENFEGLVSAWTVTGGAVADNLSEGKIKEGTKSLKVTRSGATTILYKTSSLDLSQFLDGVLSQTSDDISIWVYVADTTNLTSITIRLYSDTGTPKHFSKVFTVASGAIAKTTSGAMIQLRAAKSAYTDTGTANWAAIIRIEIEIASTGTINLYFDDWCLQEGILLYQLCTMENSETWVYGTAGSGGFNTNSAFKSQGDSSIYLKVPGSSTYTLTRTLGAAINLSQFEGGEASGTSDVIALWLYWNNYSHLKSIKLQIDCNTGDFATDYYEYEIFPKDLAALLNMSGESGSRLSWKSTQIEIEKESFTRIGDTGAKSWATVKAYRFIVATQGKESVTVYFDDLRMIRRRGLSGTYQWCCVFCSAGGDKSAYSEWSEQVTIEGTKALLRLLPTSADAKVSERRFYRKGGNLGNDARLDFTIYDNTTTEYLSETSDDLLGELFDLNQIPDGTIRVPLGAKWGPKFKGEYILYRDPSDLKSLYFSLPDRIYGWSERKKFTFESDLLDCFMIDDILFLNTKGGIKSLSVPLSQAIPSDFQERGIVKHSMGPFASCEVEGARAIVSYDGVYIFNGGSFQYISDNVRNYFDSDSYDLSETIAFYRERHLYISVLSTGGVRTFLDCYLPKLAWRTGSYVINCFCVAQGIGDNNEIYIGDKSGSVYQFDTGYASSFEAVTKDYRADNANPFAEVVLSEIFVMARSVSSDAGAINIQFRMNQLLNAGIIKAFPSTGNLGSTYKLYHHQLQGVSDYLKGSKVGLSISPGTLAKHFAIEAILLKGEVSPLPETYEEDSTVGADLLIFLGRLSSDPSTSSWGASDAGKYFWFNTTESQWKGWSGTGIVVIGSFGIGTLANDATPSVAGRDKWLTGGTTTITDFDDGYVGQTITIISEHAITITDGTNIFLNGSVNFVMKATDTLTLIQKVDGKWYELSRSVN